MSKIKSILRDVGYCSIGAAAVIVEAGSKAVQALIRKGEKTLQDNQDTVEDIKRRARDLGEKAKAAVQKPARPEAPQVDAAQLSPEARAELRRQLDEADAACKTAEPVADEVREPDEPVADTVCEPDEPELRPVAPDVIYHTAEPAPEEDPETTPNG